jgi:hypothetical protein
VVDTRFSLVPSLPLSFPSLSLIPHSQKTHPNTQQQQVRDGDKRIVRLKEGAPRGRHVVIVDDLVQSGGTLLECAKLLQVTGAAAVSAFATHGVFPNGSYKRFLSDEGGSGGGAGASSSPSPTAAFRYFWITDSCPATAAAVAGVRPFEVLSLAEPIAATLQI